MEIDESQIQSLESEVVPETRRKKRGRETTDIPKELEEMSGSDVVKILEFLHRKYLSWMTEAEGSKYATLYKSAKEDALKETLEAYAELQKTNQALIERLERLVESLENRLVAQPAVQPQEVAKETAKELKKSLLDDPRVRALLYVVADYFMGKNPELAKYRAIVANILFPEALESNPPASTGETGESTT
jgi:flagellar biosynthesis/type III secretory pathway protein FliH